MGLILKSLPVLGDLGEATLEVLFDSGARSSAVRRDIASRLATMTPLRSPKRFGLADRDASMQATEAAILSLEVDGKQIDGRFYVLPTLRQEIVVGADFMQNWSVSLDPGSEAVHVGADPQNVEFF